MLDSAALGLLTHNTAEASAVGIGLSVVAVLGMPLLARRKRTIAARIGSARIFRSRRAPFPQR